MKITVTSVRGLTLHPSRCYDYEFENVLVDVAGATLLDLSAIPTALGAVPAFMDGLFRTVGFERRITVAFTVTDDSVVILRLFYGGRDWEERLVRTRT